MKRFLSISIILLLAIGFFSWTYKHNIFLQPITLLPAEFFSPNNDNNNDYFVIKNIENYPINKIHIFNRWGDKVFVAEPYENNWNGVSNADNQYFGKNVPDGTYFFRLEYLIGDFKGEKNGKIILMR